MSARANGRVSRDMAVAAAGSTVFSLSLGICALAVPLTALAHGYGVIEIGVLTAVSALFQTAARPAMGPVMRHIPDWMLIAAAGLALAVANAILVISADLVPFLLSQLLQGLARAGYWTGIQTHAVRGPGPTVRAIATVNFYGSMGLLVGPLLAGSLAELSLNLALVIGAILPLITLVLSFFLNRLPPFGPVLHSLPGRLWRRPLVIAGCWACAVSGAWMGLLSSYVPVLLDDAGNSAALVGLLISVGYAAALAGAAAVGIVCPSWTGRTFVVATLLAGAGTGVVALFASSPFIAACTLAGSGLGAGVLQSLGPALAADAVHREERGDAIAVTGTFRAAAQFLGPLGVASVISAIPIAAAMGLIGTCMLAPAWSARRLKPRS